nr:hypothetical protein Iba_chr13aCG11160 [Ipomoea batatas]
MRDFNHRPEGKGRKGRVIKKLRFLSYLVAAVNRKFSLIWKMVDNADGFAEFTLAGIVGGEVADELDAVVCGGDTGAAGFGVGEDAVAESEPPGSPPGVIRRPPIPSSTTAPSAPAIAPRSRRSPATRNRADAFPSPAFRSIAPNSSLLNTPAATQTPLLHCSLSSAPQ